MCLCVCLRLIASYLQSLRGGRFVPTILHCCFKIPTLSAYNCATFLQRTPFLIYESRSSIVLGLCVHTAHCIYTELALLYKVQKSLTPGALTTQLMFYESLFQKAYPYELFAKYNLTLNYLASSRNIATAEKLAAFLRRNQSFVNFK